MSDQEDRIRAVARAASDWIDPGYGPRVEAVELTLSGDNRFTEEALAFAINQQMSELTGQVLTRWLGGRFAAATLPVGLLYSGEVPLEGFRSWLAILLTGHRCLGVSPVASAHLLPAFAAEVRRHYPAAATHFVSYEEMMEGAQAILASGSGEAMEALQKDGRRHGLEDAQMLLRVRRHGVAVIDGKETEEERAGLAEDTLLHEGLGDCNIALIWAPRDVPPDAYLEAFAFFRGVFPAHPGTPASLKMRQAFLQATGAPHAYGEGLEFLLSKGEAQFQEPGHIRWVEYDRIEEAVDWINIHQKSIQWVAASRRIHHNLTVLPKPALLGEAHRPSLERHRGGDDLLEYLTMLNAELASEEGEAPRDLE